MVASEFELQKAVYRHTTQNQGIVVPNNSMLGWESDVLAVTRASFVHEYEIKISRGDFFADLKKPKHNDIRKWLSGEREEERPGFYSSYKVKLARPANYFWYAVPQNMVSLDEVPEYAGLLYAVDRGDWFRCQEVRKAPRLHREKIDEKDLHQLLRSLTYRYWHAKYFPELNERTEL